MIFTYKTPHGEFFNEIDYISFCRNKKIPLKYDLVTFTFSEKFDDFYFKKNFKANWVELAEQRFLELRKKYKHIRFWYSGGKDSRFVLDLAEKINFKFDEIIFFENNVFDNPEGKGLFVPNDYITNNKFKHIKLNVDYWHNFFSDRNWYLKSFNHSITTPTVLHNILRHNKVQNFYKEVPDSVNLTGGITPYVWYEKNWNFIFRSSVCEMWVGDAVESFMFSENIPEIYNLYIANIVSNMEKQNYFPTFQNALTKDVNFSRQFASEFDKIVTQFQFLKKEPNPLDKGKPWHIFNTRPKDKLTLETLKSFHPQIYNLYTEKTDWKLLSRLGKIFTKRYVLSDI